MLKNIDKSDLIKVILAQLADDLDAVTAAANVARDAATNEESISEDKHDTRSIEAGYLAGAQRKRVAEIKEVINFYKFLEPASFSKDAVISTTALIAVEFEKKCFYYFMVAKGGGLEVDLQGLKIQTLTPQTPLGEGLLGLERGESLKIEIKGKIRTYLVTEIK